MSELALPLHFESGRLWEKGGEAVDWSELALLGRPVTHSLSPRLHAAALAEIGVAHRYRAVEVADDELSACVEHARRAGVRGLNVTLPHKSRALQASARASDEAADIGAANTLVPCDGGWMAHNTDARGLAMALERMLGRRLGRALGCAVVLGSGGAARGAVYCLRSLGAREIRLVCRRAESGVWAEEAGTRVLPWRPESLAEATLLLNATPVGLDPADPSPLPLETVDAQAAVMDLSYASHPSGLLREAADRGLVHADGLAMLVGQAALAFGMWYGGLPPVAVMARAVGLRW